jgi:hypothetical protein
MEDINDLIKLEDYIIGFELFNDRKSLNYFIKYLKDFTIVYSEKVKNDFIFEDSEVFQKLENIISVYEESGKNKDLLYWAVLSSLDRIYLKIGEFYFTKMDNCLNITSFVDQRFLDFTKNKLIKYTEKIIDLFPENYDRYYQFLASLYNLKDYDYKSSKINQAFKKFIKFNQGKCEKMKSWVFENLTEYYADFINILEQENGIKNELGGIL